MQAHHVDMSQMILPPYLVFIGFSLSAGYVRTPCSGPGQVADGMLVVRPQESPLGPSQERTLLWPHAWEIVREHYRVPFSAPFDGSICSEMLAVPIFCGTLVLIIIGFEGAHPPTLFIHLPNLTYLSCDDCTIFQGTPPHQEGFPLGRP